MNTIFRICETAVPESVHNREMNKMCQLQSDFFSDPKAGLKKNGKTIFIL